MNKYCIAVVDIISTLGGFEKVGKDSNSIIEKGGYRFLKNLVFIFS